MSNTERVKLSHADIAIMSSAFDAGGTAAVFAQFPQFSKKFLETKLRSLGKLALYASDFADIEDIVDSVKAKSYPHVFAEQVRIRMNQIIADHEAEIAK